jgi:hypothetical protein
MIDLPLSPFWAFSLVEKSIRYVESMRAWSSNPPPATKISFDSTFSENSATIRIVSFGWGAKLSIVHTALQQNPCHRTASGLPVVPQRQSSQVPRSRLPGTNLLDEWIGDLELIAEVVASQLAKITCPTGREYIENRFQRQSASPGR